MTGRRAHLSSHYLAAGPRDSVLRTRPAALDLRAASCVGYANFDRGFGGISGNMIEIEVELVLITSINGQKLFH